ncbi:MAG: DUF58 domain-containing protein [Candidatus Melainabacteria bacterium]|nr:DUF58 domain-containing protein [Candidatus Melainabacteria bacterium]
MKYKSWSLQKKSCSGTWQYATTLKDFIRQIDVNKRKFKKIGALMHGSFTSSTRGVGFDFNEIREYVIGDDLRHISWNATAKTSTLQTKEYFAEKEIRTFFLIDISNSMLCGSKSETFIQLFAFLLNLASDFSEKIGGAFFSGDINYFFPLASAYNQSNIMFQTFFSFFNNLKEKIIPEPTNTNITKALEFARKYFCKKGLLIIISDFINLKGWEKQIYEVSQNQNIFSFQIYDPIDYKLPKAGYTTIIDPETKQHFTVNTDSRIVQEAYKNLMSQKQEKLNSLLQTIGINHIIIERNDFK